MHGHSQLVNGHRCRNHHFPQLLQHSQWRALSNLSLLQLPNGHLHYLHLLNSHVLVLHNQIYAQFIRIEQKDGRCYDHYTLLLIHDLQRFPDSVAMVEGIERQSKRKREEEGANDSWGTGLPVEGVDILSCIFAWNILGINLCSFLTDTHSTLHEQKECQEDERIKTRMASLRNDLRAGSHVLCPSNLQ